MAESRLESLKAQKAYKQEVQHTLSTNVAAITFMLSQMLRYVSPDYWIDHLRHIYDVRFERSTLAELLTREITGSQTIEVSEEEAQTRKRIDGVVRTKEELSKKEIKEQASTRFMAKYKEELFRKYQGHNKELV